MNDGNTVALRQYEYEQHKLAEQAELDMEEEINRLLTTAGGISELLGSEDKHPMLLTGLRMLLASHNNNGGMWTYGIKCIRIAMESMATNKAEEKIEDMLYGD